ncbi:MAG TPA: HipA family kinase [Terriglobales bacterium]|nr:HipA family kinase [Terriglobales bacterium]
MPIQAVQHVRRMRGGAQSHLMRCADGYHYVAKFPNNPQHPRVLVNDWLGTRLAEMIGLPVPVPAIVDVHPWLVEHTPDLRVELCGQRTMFTPGLSFGSRYVVSPLEGQVYDCLPEGMLGRVRNINSFVGVLALDKWTCNSDGRQVAFWRRPRESSPPASSIRDTFSTPASGVFPTRHCAASSGATTSMSVSQGGTASSRG